MNSINLPTAFSAQSALVTQQYAREVYIDSTEPPEPYKFGGAGVDIEFGVKPETIRQELDPAGTRGLEIVSAHILFPRAGGLRVSEDAQQEYNSRLPAGQVGFEFSEELTQANANLVAIYGVQLALQVNVGEEPYEIMSAPISVFTTRKEVDIPRRLPELSPSTLNA